MYRSNVRLVYAYARARLGPEDGHDVTAEVFQAAVLAFQDDQAETITTAWLMAVTRNKVIDRWRKAGRRKAKLHLLKTLVQSPDQPENLLVDRQRREQVLAALDRLSAEHRMLLVLHHVDGVPLRELASDVGKSPDAVKSALARARREFRKTYEKQKDL